MLSITTDSLSAGVLTVDFNGADNLATTQSGGSVLVNGASPAGGGSASSVTAINFAGSGNFDNVIDLSGVGAAQGFTNLATVTVNTASAATGDQVDGTHVTVHESAIDFALSTVGNWTSV